MITGENYTLYLGDCLDILPGLEAGSVDAVIADIPYGTTACKWDSVIPFEPMWAGIKHVIKERAAVVLFGSQPFTSALVMSNPKWFKYCWVWDKRVSGSFANAKYAPLKTHEDICVFGVSKVKYVPQMILRDKPLKIGGVKSGSTQGGEAIVYNEAKLSSKKIYICAYPKSIKYFLPRGNGNRGLHPTQKPTHLMEYLIKTYTNPGDTVLDFTFGSGTTGVAAMRTGRRFIGIELDPDYFRVAEQRIKNAAGDYVMTDKELATGQMPLLMEAA